uniref:Uncharacterized protein LOC112838781 n=1 Tax=Callorhinus ursinus TaxID=34884 RepID=A0A3Q7QNV0_CALUR|nr:uncharacterized protein LOC112838781 [Callorhinus ursinus]
MQNSSSAGEAGPAPTPDPDRLLRGGGELRRKEGCGEQGAGGAAAATAPLSLRVRLPTPGAAQKAAGTDAREARSPHAGHCSPDRAGAGEPATRGAGPRATTTG